MALGVEDGSQILPTARPVIMRAVGIVAGYGMDD
jgi:hypothetical protein